MNNNLRYVDRRNPNDVYTIARVCDDMVWLKKEGGGLYESSESDIHHNFQEAAKEHLERNGQEINAFMAKLEQE